MKGYKTLTAASVITAIGMAQQMGVIALVPEHYRGATLAGVGLIMALLRLKTNTQVGRRH
ncbi:MAG: hypothetical protein FD163_2557 [Hyphomonadaceae bacterium]|nr:MAG: hypothetical protein FD128_2842 [Hyphomonadaceae bacterium]KAF0182580.1 MAG: hypothetical protein FD163_2557 [Hyphomonadaceae bacterium]